MSEFLNTIFTYWLWGMGISLVLASLLFILFVRQIRHIDVPPDADFAETLRHTPFTVVLFVDLLDLGLDILAVPIVWVFLDRIGLKALRGVSVFEAAVPLTQAIPTLTLCWLGARLGADPLNGQVPAGTKVNANKVTIIDP